MTVAFPYLVQKTLLSGSIKKKLILELHLCQISLQTTISSFPRQFYITSSTVIFVNNDPQYVKKRLYFSQIKILLYK